jgi:hypothetical protein
MALISATCHAGGCKVTAPTRHVPVTGAAGIESGKISGAFRKPCGEWFIHSLVTQSKVAAHVAAAIFRLNDLPDNRFLVSARIYPGTAHLLDTPSHPHFLRVSTLSQERKTCEFTRLRHHPGKGH